MQRRLYIVTLMLALSLAISAQVHRVGVGLSGGVNTMFADTSLTNLWGPTIGLEGYYACLFAVDNSEFMLGPRTGIEVAWSQSGWTSPVNEQFSNTDYLGHQIDYTISGSVREKHQHLTVSIPIMLAMRYRGLVVGIGVKARMLLWNTYSTSVSDLYVSAYYPEFDIAVVDEPNLGIVNKVDDISGSRATPEWHVPVAAEIGYEWQVKKNQFLGFRIFADYDIWNSFKQPADAAKRVIDITPITEANKTADVNVAPICNAALTKFNALNIGVTISYTFDFIDNSHHCNCLPY